MCFIIKGMLDAFYTDLECMYEGHTCIFGPRLYITIVSFMCRNLVLLLHMQVTCVPFVACVCWRLARNLLWRNLVELGVAESMGSKKTTPFVIQTTGVVLSRCFGLHDLSFLKWELIIVFETSIADLIIMHVSCSEAIIMWVLEKIIQVP